MEIRKWIVLFLSSALGTYSSASAIGNYLNLADMPCGQVKVKKARILGGMTTDIEEFPFLASIQSDGRHFCTGFIIKRQVLVTAAHCFIESLYGSKAYKDYEIIVGSSNWTEYESGNSFRINNVTIHPDYSYLKPNVENDIAILRLDREVEWSDKIRPVCLPKGNVKERFGLIAGWGVREEKQKLQEWMKDTSLYKVKLPIWDNNECQMEYRKNEINWNMKPSHVCAGNQDMIKDTCHGDSGSPLIVEGSGRRIAYGIVSVGEGCASKLPGIYTRVDSFSKWIEENS